MIKAYKARVLIDSSVSPAYTFKAGHSARWIHADVAQLAEQLFRKQQVSSSSLLVGSLSTWLAAHRRFGRLLAVAPLPKAPVAAAMALRLIVA